MLCSVSLINVASCRYKKAAHHRRHRHNFYHFVYLTGGKGEIWVDDQAQPVGANYAYMVCPGVFHEYVNDRNEPLHTIEVKFVVQDDKLAQSLAALPFSADCSDLNAVPQLELLLQEARQQRPYYKDLMASSFLQFLLLLLRAHAPDRASSASSDVSAASRPNDLTPSSILPFIREQDDLCASIVQYVAEHYQDKITLTDLAKRFALSRTYLCDRFRQKYGISPIQLLNRIRLNKAKQLLADERMSITDISEHTGFQSIHHLSKFFSKKVGMSPMQYRERHHRSEYLEVEEKYRVVAGILLDG